MATRYEITLPNGNRMRVFYRKGVDTAEVVSDLQLAKWETFCLRNWLSDNPDTRYSAERRVKAFLDGCAYLLLRDNPADTLTEYKDTLNAAREIPVSACPAFVEDVLESCRQASDEDDDIDAARFTLLLERLDERTKKHQSPKRSLERARKPRPDTRFDRIERIKRLFPGCTLSLHRVDIENRFVMGGDAYAIDEAVEAYRPIDTAEGEWYEMDEVWVVCEADGRLHFYDQRLEPIADEMIHPV